MDVFTQQQLRELSEAGTSPCVTVYIPTHKMSREVRQDPVLLRDHLRDIQNKLVSQGVPKRDIEEIVAPVQDLLNDDDFWQNNESGLALFMSKGFFKQLRLPIEVEDTVVVNEHFHLKPLLPLLTDKLFYVLALSQHAPRLLECTQHTCKVLPLPPDVALRIEDAIAGEDEHQNTTQRHSVDTKNPHSAGGSFHGQADIQRKEHEDRMFFLRQLDDGIMRTIKHGDLPVVLAGVDSITPFYRRASNLKNIVDEEIHGSPEHVADGDLHQRAITIMELLWQEDVRQLQERFNAALSHDLGSNAVQEVLPAAMQGRVDTLLLPVGKSLWGSFNDGNIEVHPDMQDGDEDLLDLVAAQTIKTSGRVVSIEPEQMPLSSDLAAIYRY